MAKRRRGGLRGAANRRAQISNQPVPDPVSSQSPTESEESCGSNTAQPMLVSAVTHKKFGKFRCLMLDKNEISGSDSDMAVEVVGIVDPNQSSESEACDKTSEKDEAEKDDDIDISGPDEILTVIEVIEPDKINESLEKMTVSEKIKESDKSSSNVPLENTNVKEENEPVQEKPQIFNTEDSNSALNNGENLAVDSPRSLQSSTDTTNDSNLSAEGENVRRSSRIRFISELKGKSKGRGVVQTKAMLKQGFDNDIITPVKVKQRWRRSSELDAAREDPEMEQRLRQFVHLKDNLYLTERITSKEAKRMTCDCFLTKEEIEAGEYGCGDDCLNRLLMIECGNYCVVGDRCTNKRFQNLKYASCEVFRTEKKGFGIRALKDMVVGDFIMEYVGEVVDQEEFEKRAEVYSEDKNRHYYFMSLRADAIIDATQKGNVSRFINHSCEPNAETQKWTVNGELRIGFFARKDVKAGDEITFDYRFQRYGKEAQKCYCEAPSCRGWIGEEPGDEDEDEEEEEEEEDEEDTSVESTDVKNEVDDIVKPETETEEVTETKTIPKEQKPKRRTLKLKPKVTEDIDLDEEMNKLSISGIKNQAHTLTLSRLFVRARDNAFQMKLMRLLREAEMPCRRLFLDYHGLRLIHTWITSEQSVDFKVEVLETLASLPIPNKTMLQDSKILDTVQKWSVGCLNESPETDSGENTPADVTVVPKKTDETDVEMKKEEKPIQNNSNMITLAAKLLSDWSSLKEVFRIPKKERIEQMKEHEREADRVGLQVVNEEVPTPNERYERYRERPVRKSIPTVSPALSKQERRQLFAIQVAQEEEERRRQMEAWRQHEQHCAQFGLDPRQPYPCVPWWRPPGVPPPILPQVPPGGPPPFLPDMMQPMIPSNFHPPLPAGAPPNMPPNLAPSLTTPPNINLSAAPPPPPPPLPPPVRLPPKWKCARDKLGRPYYYHIKIRISQWEPPEFPPPVIQQEPVEKTIIDSSTSSSEESSTVSETSSEEDSTDEDEADMDDTQLMLDVRQKLNLVAPVATPQPSVEPVEQIGKKRRDALVQEIIISPRTEEDKKNSKEELKKYRETKEKLRRRKEAKSKAKRLHAHALNTTASTVEKVKAPHVPVPVDPEKEYKIKKNFQKKMANVMVHILSPYKKSDCEQGRIVNTEDFKHLAKKLTMFVMLKELKNCRSVNDLTVNDSVKMKAREFVKKYMAKFGKVYKRPKEENE